MSWMNPWIPGSVEIVENVWAKNEVAGIEHVMAFENDTVPNTANTEDDF